MTHYRTDLSRVRGLGSIKAGTWHFWLSRLTGAANLVLVFFVFFSAFHLVGASLSDVHVYFSSPIVASLAVLTVLSWAYHMWLGMQMIIGDYIQKELMRPIMLMFNTFFAIGVSIACVVSILKLSLGA